LLERLPGESDNDYWRRHFAQQRAERAQRLEESRTRALTEGKEPFDEERFKALYLAPWGDYEDLETLEYDYYAVHVDLKTVEEYAASCMTRDIYDGGDMHLDR